MGAPLARISGWQSQATMKLTTRVMLLMLCVLALALGGSLLLHTWAARAALQEQACSKHHPSGSNNCFINNKLFCD